MKPPCRTVAFHLALLTLALAPRAIAQQATDVQPGQRITPAQAKALFNSINELTDFASEESGLPVRHEIKRRLVSRAQIEADLRKKFDDDKDAKRIERSGIVIKKFGLLDRDFKLRPFLLSLLTEQIAGYYDPKTRTINLLDWLDADEQKPVMAHELTHALQDQHTDLVHWDDQSPDRVSTKFSEDLDHIARDEMDEAREAVLEGQATAVFTDYILKPSGRSLIKDPEVIEYIHQQLAHNDADSPVMARAPLLLSESMLFPYRDGLGFVQDIWMDKGRDAAFTGLLDSPPTSSWEIFNPVDFEKRIPPAIPQMPDIHPLVDKTYKPYDIGQMGQLDTNILLELFAGKDAATGLAPAWDGGIYWAGIRRTANEASPTTADVALIYLSAWKNSESAQRFAQIYAGELGNKYSGLKHDEAASLGGTDTYTTSEGPVTITTRGRLVFVTESIPLDLAAQLARLAFDAQGTGELKQAQRNAPDRQFEKVARTPGHDFEAGDTLTGGFVRFFANHGMMKFILDAAQPRQSTPAAATH